MFYTIKWNGDSVSILDQRLLPVEETYHEYRDFTSIAEAIRNMEVRGAPAIGIAAAMGIALGAKNSSVQNLEEYKQEIHRIIGTFCKTRPTAVNLFRAAKRMGDIVTRGADIGAIKDALEKEALRIYDGDLEANRAIGKNGRKFLSDGDTVLTHCNAGALATAGYGTALGMIRAAAENGMKIEVYACETRPLLQGARLTAWELLKSGIPVSLITDSMAGYFMKKGVIKKVIVGADRIALNGDTANKIGTYSLSVLAKKHGIPFYVAAPVSTLDPDTKTGADIPIEERSIDEVVYCGGNQIAPEGVFVRNPAFDVTPAENITAIITDRGVVENPLSSGIAGVLK